MCCSVVPFWNRARHFFSERCTPTYWLVVEEAAAEDEDDEDEDTDVEDSDDEDDGKGENVLCRCMLSRH